MFSKLDCIKCFRDRRSLGASRRPSGVLVGHTEGITYVSAKGDGRYIISNGKDQATRLWDLRKMRSSAEFDEIQRDRNVYGIPEFDYRFATCHTMHSFENVSLPILTGTRITLNRTTQHIQRTAVL